MLKEVKKLTEKASFSKKFAIPLGYFASYREPEFTNTKKKKQIWSISFGEQQHNSQRIIL